MYSSVFGHKIGKHHEVEARKERAESLMEYRKQNRHHWEIALEDLQVISRIGSGSYGTVYRAKWMGVNVAVKKVNINESFSLPEYLSFLYEISMMSNLRHPNVTMLLGGCVEPPNLCFVTEFMEQGSLDVVLQKYPLLDWKVRLNMAIEVARGLVS